MLASPHMEEDLNDYSHKENLPQVIDTNIKSPTISDDKKMESRDKVKILNKSPTADDSTNKNMLKRVINLTKFLKSTTDTNDLDHPDDDNNGLDVQDNADDTKNNDIVGDGNNDWIKAVKGSKHVISGPPVPIQNCSASSKANPTSLFTNFSEDHDNEEASDVNQDDVIFTQDRRSPSQRSNADDVSRISSTTSYRHRDINSMMQK